MNAEDQKLLALDLLEQGLGAEAVAVVVGVTPKKIKMWEIQARVVDTQGKSKNSEAVSANEKPVLKDTEPKDTDGKELSLNELATRKFGKSPEESLIDIVIQLKQLGELGSVQALSNAAKYTRELIELTKDKSDSVGERIDKAIQEALKAKEKVAELDKKHEDAREAKNVVHLQQAANDN